MRKLIIIASLLAYCVAAPTSKEQGDSVLLQRPSPINPDVPSDPKPPEKIIKIADPKEIVNHKREAEDDPYNHISRFAPTPHPARQVEKQNSHEFEPKQHVEADPSHHHEKREKEQNKRPLGVSKKFVASTPAPARDLPKHRQRRQVDPHLLGASAVGVTPLLSRDDDKKTDETEAPLEAKSSEESVESTAAPATRESSQAKRDIPVPLVPKYHHPEETPKSKSEKGKNNDDRKSEESGESDEDSNEKKPALPIHSQQPTKQSVQPLLAQQQQPETAAKPSHAGVENTRPESIQPLAAAEHDKPVEAAHSQVLEQHQAQISAQPSHVVEQSDKSESHNTAALDPESIQHQHKQEPATEQNKSYSALNNTPVLKQLGGIEPTQIISYETPASDITVPIKHPVPVAELFSGPKQ